MNLWLRDQRTASNSRISGCITSLLPTESDRRPSAFIFYQKFTLTIFVLTNDIGMRTIIFWSVIVHGVCAPVCADTGNLYSKLILAAKEQTLKPVTYDGSYVRIGYPNGDVPVNKGVCTDVLIRAYRKVGIDLQVKVHED